jgi:hypothetical protein
MRKDDKHGLLNRLIALQGEINLLQGWAGDLKHHETIKEKLNTIIATVETL